LKKVFRAAAREKTPAPARTPPGPTAASPCRPVPAQTPARRLTPVRHTHPNPGQDAYPEQLRIPAGHPRNTRCTPKGGSDPYS